MAEKTSISTRIKRYKQQAKGMLMPGLRPSTRGESAPAIFTHFGVGKAKLAAPKMRFLDHRQMGKKQTETIKAFAKAIPQKFKQAQRLLHINPHVSRDATIWNEIEKTLPQQSASYEEPAQPGELRAGTVIQKFSMFPKEGQSTEEFKEQVQTIPKFRRKPRPKKAAMAVDPKSRLFTRVQEIPQKGAEEKPAARASKPLASVKKSTVQRQLDIVPPSPKETPPEPQQEETPVTVTSKPVEEESAPAESLEIEAPEAPPVAQPIDEEITLAMDLTLKKPVKPKTAQPKESATPQKKVARAQEKHRVQAKPAQAKHAAPKKAPLPTALLVQKRVAKPASPPTVQRKVDVPTAKPVVKPLARKAAGKPKETPAPARPIFEETPQQIIKPPSVKDVAPQVEKTEKIAYPPAEEKTPQELPPVIDTEIEIEEKATSPQPRLEEVPPVDMPLRRKIQAHRETPKAIKALRPEQIKPKQQKPLLAPQPKPLVSPKKYTRTEQAIVPAQETLTPNSQIHQTPATPQISTERADLARIFEEHFASPSSRPPAPKPTQPVQDGKQQLSMTLAKPPRLAQSKPAEKQKEQPLPLELLFLNQRQPPPREEQRRFEKPPLPIPVNAQESGLAEGVSVASKKIVQREPDKDASETAFPVEEAPDLDQLAEDVLPYVKRILEIESERTPGSLR